MKTFRDNAGRTWTIALNIGSFKRVLGMTKLDLLGDPGEAVARMSRDGMALCDVVYAIIKPEADTQGVSDEQFGEAMGGEPMRLATDALMEELSDFFQRYRPDLGNVVAATLKKIKQVDPAAARLAMAKLDGLDIEALVGGLSTSAPESLE